MSIKVKRNEPFTMVPNHLVNNENISCEALAAITYLAGKPDGWIARTYDIKKRFKWGDFIWRRVSRELRALGLLKDEKHAGGTDLIFELIWEPVDKTDKSVDKPVDNPVHNLCNAPVVKPHLLESHPCETHGYNNKEYTNKDSSYKKRFIEEGKQQQNFIKEEIRKVANKCKMASTKHVVAKTQQSLSARGSHVGKL